MATPRLLKQVVSSQAVQWTVTAIVSFYMLLVLRSSRIERPEPPPGGPFIIALWHAHLALSPTLRFGERNLVALISGHRDGQLISKCAGFYGMQTVTGSSTRGGMAAVRQLLRLTQKAHNLFITPDGPRGPRHKVNEGVIEIARLSGLPILPVGIGNSGGWAFDTWDRIRLPGLFSRIVVRFGEPIAGGKGISGAELEATLNSLQQAADKAAGRTAS